jgi:hypothetical protein
VVTGAGAGVPIRRRLRVHRRITFVGEEPRSLRQVFGSHLRFSKVRL